MKRSRMRFMVGFCLPLFLGLFFRASPVTSTDKTDLHLYGKLLHKYVKKGIVDYGGFKNEEVKLDQYLSILEKTDTGTLSRSYQLAFYINAYNAWTIKLILGGYPGIKSIKDLGNFFSSPWKKKICHIDGKVISLDDLEEKIRGFRDPRVHFAINCASKSCPPLRPEPFQGDILNEQLNAAARAFINNPERNRLKGDTLYVSRIFHWYKNDFKGGGVAAFIRKYADGGLRKRLEAEGGRLRIEYLHYDWSLNGK